jgi:uncharacterized membrane protein YoaK (UPF0700 family)
MKTTMGAASAGRWNGQRRDGQSFMDYGRAIWAGFLGGALLSGAATPRFGTWALLFPMLALLVLAAFDRSSSAQPQRYERVALPEEFKEIRQHQ